MSKFSRKSGSAILIALFLMSTIGVISFGSTRTYLSEARSNRNYISTNASYYLAEAALEEGLYLRKSDRRVQVSDECDKPNADGVVAGGVECIVLSSHNFWPLKDGKSGVRISRYGDITETKCTSESRCELKKDSSAEVQLPKNWRVLLNWEWTAGPPVSNPAQALIRIIAYDEKGEQRADQGAVIYPSESSKTLNNSFDEDLIFRFRPLGGDIKYWLSDGYVDSETNMQLADLGKTRIDAYGQAGDSVRRQLRLEIDESSGRLNSIFDYTIYGLNILQRTPGS